MKKASVGLIAVFAAALFGFLLYRVTDRYVYENGLNLNFKLLAVIVLAVLLVAGAAIVGLKLGRTK